MNLTTEQINAMSAGPAMNAAVAVDVLSKIPCNGWVAIYGGWLAGECHEKKCDHDDNSCFPAQSPPDYSGNIAAAFELQAEIERRGLWEEYVRHLVSLITTAEHAARSLWYASPADWWVIANASALNRCKAALLMLAKRQEG